jgi:triacylglycerol lipase
MEFDKNVFSPIIIAARRSIMTYPIILAHGVCRLDQFHSKIVDNNDNPIMDKFHYFRGIRTMLKAKGFTVYHSRVGWAGGVEKRAEDLYKQVIKILEQSEAEKVNIIAHSMGGLDARHMMFNHRNSGKIHERIASLTTISTPHEGSPFADFLVNKVPGLMRAAKKLYLEIGAAKDLTTDRCKAFQQNQDVRDFEDDIKKDILLQSYAGKQTFLKVYGLLKVPFYIIEKIEGENDGVVSVKSATWRDEFFKGTINADHVNEMGWWDAEQLFEHETPKKLYDRVNRFYYKIAGGLP